MTDNNPSTSHVWRREEQWVARVLQYSSQYNDSTWSANQVIGPPKVYPRHGDITGAWAQGNRANNEFIVVEFERAFYPEQIDIYETYNPGAVVGVSVRNGNENAAWEIVWRTEAPHVEARSRIFSIPCRHLSTKEINQVRLDVNCTAAGNWCEIDAIKLIGHASLQDISYKELIGNLKTLLVDDSLADVLFELDDGQIVQSYRNILSSRCIYFDQLFKRQIANDSSPIRIGNISYASFYQILHYIFTDHIEPVLTDEVCLELMRKADEFHLSCIYNEAFEILKRLVNKNNVLKILVHSGLFAEPSDNNEQNLILPDVIDFCVDFAQKNRRDFYFSDYIHRLTKDMLIAIVQLVQ